LSLDEAIDNDCPNIGHKTTPHHFGSRNNNKKHYQLPILIHKEYDHFIAECPLFYVAGDGFTVDAAIMDVKNALEVFLSDEDVQKDLPDKIVYTKENMIKKAIELFREYADPGEEPPEYIQYLLICI
jgi:predicted RNase H-like HicB family nuclease